MNKIIKWWKRRNFDLRQACIDKYSKEFVEKAKAYDEAVKAAKSKIKNDKDHVLYENDILDIFPELNESESEDEKIRKAIINFLHEGNPFKNIKKETRQRWIAWLEKQGEQKSFAKYKVGDTIYYDSFGRLVSFVIANIVEDGTDNPMYEDKDGNSVFQNDIVEQKLAWSEKDKEYINDLIAYFDGGSLQHVTSDVILWLKSLKDRYTWKPSEMQLDTIEQIIDGEPHERDLRIKLLKILKG